MLNKFKNIKNYIIDVCAPFACMQSFLKKRLYVMTNVLKNNVVKVILGMPFFYTRKNVFPQTLMCEDMMCKWIG
jgi:hypothetical protein